MSLRFSGKTLPQGVSLQGLLSKNQSFDTQDAELYTCTHVKNFKLALNRNFALCAGNKLIEVEIGERNGVLVAPKILKFEGIPNQKEITINNATNIQCSQISEQVADDIREYFILTCTGTKNESKVAILVSLYVSQNTSSGKLEFRLKSKDFLMSSGAKELSLNTSIKTSGASS